MQSPVVPLLLLMMMMILSDFRVVGIKNKNSYKVLQVDSGIVPAFILVVGQLLSCALFRAVAMLLVPLLI